MTCSRRAQRGVCRVGHASKMPGKTQETHCVRQQDIRAGLAILVLLPQMVIQSVAQPIRVIKRLVGVALRTALSTVPPL